MKILVLADVVPFPPNTGIKIRTFNIVRELARTGDEVYLVCFNHRIFLPTESDKEVCRQELAKYCREVHILEIPSERSHFASYWVLVKSIFQRKPYRDHRYDSSECAELIQSSHQRVGLDLVHLDKTEFFEYSRLLPDVPAVPTNHNVESRLFQRRASRDVNLPRRAFAWLQYLKTRAYEKHVLNRVPAYIVCTDIDHEYFRDQLGVGSRAFVVPNGVDVNHYRVVGPKKPYFLVIGAQSREATANFDATVFLRREIWPKVRELGIALKIVGRNPDPEIVAWGKEDPLVEVVGFVDDEREYLGHALALLVPLRIGGGSRLKILTAMSMGTPVVATPIGAEGIVCEHGLDILLAATAEQFCREIKRLVADTALQASLQAQSRRRIESLYDWQMIGKTIRELYRSLAMESR
jgi:glycosyltransferase involved in cell wall biosynthesis